MGIKDFVAFCTESVYVKVCVVGFKHEEDTKWSELESVWENDKDQC